MKYRGVNEAGAEFGSQGEVGQYNNHYTYPTNESIDYFIAQGKWPYKYLGIVFIHRMMLGMNTIRFPFMWERVQRTLGSDLDSEEMARMDNTVNYVTNTKKAFIILDVHNYARYKHQVIGSSKFT